MANLILKKIGGYDEHFLDELKDKHKCPVCLLALCEPIQTQCGHRLCMSCSEEIKKRNGGVLYCPLDNSISNPERTFPDVAFERVILQLKVKCNNFKQSCPWIGALTNINSHLESCEYQEIDCLNEKCSTSLLRKELRDHMETRCNYRSVICQYCNLCITFSMLQLHLDNCICFRLDCSNQCGMRILRKEMASHITDGCALTTIPCQYLNIGCNFQGIRKEHDDHTSSSTNKHLSMAISKLTILEKKILSNEKDIKSKMDILESKVMSIKNEITENMLVLENKFKKMTSLENNIVPIEKKLTEKMLILENNILSVKKEMIPKMANIDNKINSNTKQMEKQETLKEQLLNLLQANQNPISLMLRSLHRPERFGEEEFLHELIKLIKLSMANSE